MAIKAKVDNFDWRKIRRVTEICLFSFFIMAVEFHHELTPNFHFALTR